MDGHLDFGRRRFLQSASALGLGAGLGSWELLRGITPARAADLTVGPEAVRFRPEIEPVVRWIEETPRDRALEVAVEHLKDGLSYRDLLAGLFLAGIRNIKPHPVGFKFHAVMVINSAHLLGQTAAVADRLLPLLWALDNFKNSQAQDIKEGDWTLGKVDEARLPRPDRAKAEFVRAMDDWDADAADAAVAALCRTRARPRRWSRSGATASATSGTSATSRSSPRSAGGPSRRSAGSTPSPSSARSPSACSTSMATRGTSPSDPTRPTWRTPGRSATTGRPASPTRPRPARCWRRSARRRPRRRRPRRSHAQPGGRPDSLWDAVILAGNEMLMRTPGILALHAVTSANALHFIYGASGDDTTRRLALFQAVGWQPIFRGRVKPGDGPAIDALGAEAARDPGRRGGRRDLRRRRQELESKARRREGRRLPERGRLDRPALRRRPPDDLPQGPRQPRLQVRRRRLGGMRPGHRPQVARPPRRRHDVQPPRLQAPDSPLMNRAREAVARVFG